MALGEESSTLSVLAPGAACPDSPPARARVPLAVPLDPRRVHARPALAVRLSRQRARAPARLGAVHPRGQSPQLSRRRRPRQSPCRGRSRSSSCRASIRASPLHPLFHRRIGSIPVNLERPDPGAIKRVLRALDARPHRRHLPGGPVQPRGPARRRAARRRADRAALRRARRARGHPRHLRGAPRPALLRPARAPARPSASAPPMHFGRPRHRRVTRAERDEITRRIMGEIAALLAAEREP